MKAATLRIIGILAAPQGLRGEMTVKSFDDTPRWVDALSSVFVFKRQGPVEMQIEAIRRQGREIIIKLQGVDDRDTAEKLRGCELRLPESELPPLDEDEFYADSLVGFTVKNRESDAVLGTVKEVVTGNGNDFLEVASAATGELVLVPFQTVFVPDVDVPNQTVRVTGLDELFE